MHVFFSVGEPSGDQHAAHLIRELQRRRPGIRVSGYGGPLMEQAGCTTLYQLTNLAVMGIWRVIPLLLTFYRLVQQARQFFETERLDAVELIDYPGFNWWIARKAKAAGIPVFYYLPPQLWAWGPWRIRKVRKFVDHVLCGLPFEFDWYAKRGISAEYVGHPFFDEVADAPLDREFCEQWRSPGEHGPRTIGILPGSRNHEVHRNWPMMLEIMQTLHRRHPQARFLVANYKESHRAFCESEAREFQEDLPIHYFVGKTPEIIATAECCAMVSGSVSLEMLARGTPAIVMYRAGWLTYPPMRALVRLGSVTLPNLIAGRVVLPEWMVVYFPRRDIRAMTATLDRWLSDRVALAESRADLVALRDEIAKTGATPRAAEAILTRLAPQQRRVAA